MSSLEFASRYDGIMRQPLLQAVYEGSGFFNTGWWGGGARDQVTACAALVDRLADAIPRDVTRIVDIGCGFGATTRMLRRRFPRAKVVGANISLGQVARAGGNGFTVMDAARTALASSSAEAIVSVEAAFHFDRRQDFFTEARRVLAPGGVLVLSDILFDDVAAIGEWMVPPANLIGLDAYRELLRQTGFVDVVIEDATSDCWLAYCASLGRAARGRETDRSIVERLAHSCVSHYLLVRARVPEAKPVVRVRVPAARGTLVTRSLVFLLHEWARRFAEAEHVMPFPKEQGFRGTELQNGDVFARAVIACALADANEACAGSLTPLIARDVNLLAARVRHGVAGGWSYFPDLIELPPDADDLAQLMLLFAKCGRRDLIATLCERPLAVLLRDCAHDDGSFETWIVPAEGGEEEALQRDWIARAWGGGPDPEVVANLLFALHTVDAERFADTIARGAAWLRSVQESDGSWPSSWYHGPYYGTYVALRLLATRNDARHAVRRGARFLSRALDTISDPLSAALAILGLHAAGTTKKRALAFLRTCQHGDGGFDAVPWIRMPLGRPTGHIHQVITYASRTITTAFVLQAALAAGTEE